MSGEAAIEESSLHTYSVRGVVRHIGEDSVQVRHEEVPDFRDLDGEPVGMSAMTMDFALGPGVEVEAVNVGDKIEFRLNVDFEADTPAWIDQLEVLPDDTELQF